MSFKENLLKNVDAYRHAQEVKRHIFMEVTAPETATAVSNVCNVLQERFMDASAKGRTSDDVNLSELSRREARNIIAKCSDDYECVLHYLTSSIEKKVEDHFINEGLKTKSQSFHTSFSWSEV